VSAAATDLEKGDAMQWGDARERERENCSETQTRVFVFRNTYFVFFLIQKKN
jgi:hypothetical protein